MEGSSSSYIIDDMMGIAAGLGEDVLMDILSRLPVKYVLRSRGVSKSWNALLKTPYFINKHLHRNHTTLIQGNAPLLCIDNDRMITSWIFSSDFINDDDETTTAAAATVVVEVRSTDANPFSDGKTSCCGVPIIMGPVNGIFFIAAYAFSSCSSNMYLCNPSLRELKAIPNVPSLSPSDLDGSFGFGYDSKANDYKVLAIAFERRRRNEKSIYHGFVYSSRRNSWRKIECEDYMKGFSNRPREPTFVNHGSRVAHWLISDKGYDENADHVILSFDFVNEEFQRSSLPQALNHKLRALMNEGQNIRRYVGDIGVLKDESIALIIRVPPLSPNGDFWEVWVMKEYGVRESWTKLFATGYLPWRSSFLGFVNNEREILFRDSTKDDLFWDPTKDHFVSYDPNRKKSKDFLHLKGVRFNTYMESLVSIINQ